MSATATRIPLAQAAQLAAELLDLLKPATERIIVAGSIRRGRQDVGDLEILAIPRTYQDVGFDLFGLPTETEERSELDDMAAHLKAIGALADRLDKNGRPAWGSKYKRALCKGVGLDLFTTTPDRWGTMLAIRTGPLTFSNALVTPTNRVTHDGYRGFLPSWAKVSNGGEISHAKSGEVIPMPTEEALFSWLGIGWIEPRDRAAWIEQRRVR